MRAEARFLGQNEKFWSYVRSISESAGYTAKGTRTVKTHSIGSMRAALANIGLSGAGLGSTESPTELGNSLVDYFRYRAEVLNDTVQHALMDAPAAKQMFDQVRASYGQLCPLPLNKQKGDKSGYAYFTGIINMLVEQNIGSLRVEYDPRRLTTFTKEGEPMRTLSRRLDGAFPSAIDPISVWEIKEYYYTTTFGSRIADGVYETELDGTQFASVREHDVRVDHVLFVDSRFTWWECGRSYLCRIIDLLHMGLVDEVVFGREVLDAVPRLVDRWRKLYHERESSAGSVLASARTSR